MGARVQNMCSGSSTHSSPVGLSTFSPSRFDADDAEAHVVVALEGVAEDGPEGAAAHLLLLLPGGPLSSPRAGREALGALLELS